MWHDAGIGQARGDARNAGTLWNVDKDLVGRKPAMRRTERAVTPPGGACGRDAQHDNDHQKFFHS